MSGEQQMTEAKSVEIVKIAVDFAGNRDDEVTSIWGFDAAGRMTLLGLSPRRVAVKVSNG